MPIFTSPEFQQFVEQQTGTNPVEAVRERLPERFTEGVGAAVYPRGTPISMQAGQGIYDALERKQFLKPVGDYLSSMGSDSGRTAMLTALALGIGGAGFGAITGRNPVTWGLAGAGLGALGGFGASELTQALNRRRQQRAQSNLDYMDWDRKRRINNGEIPTKAAATSYYGMGDGSPMNYIQSRIFADQSIMPSDKALLITQVQSLPQDQLLHLADILRTVVGGAVGYLITRYILNMGSLGQTLGMAAGGVMGAMMGHGLPVNAMGDRVDTMHDLFGHSRFVT